MHTSLETKANMFEGLQRDLDSPVGVEPRHADRTLLLPFTTVIAFEYSDAIMRTESALQLLRRVKKVTDEWVKPGFRKGQNTHNISATVSIKDAEWVDVGEWMWENRESYNGLSVLPFDGGTYTQAPFEDCSKETYEAMMNSLTSIDLTQVVEEEDNTDLKGEAACAGGACEIKFV